MSISHDDDDKSRSLDLFTLSILLFLVVLGLELRA
jgi:hypothetical protein